MRFSSTFSLVLSAALLAVPALAQPAANPPLYNTVKQKLLEGKQVFSFTQSKFDIAGILRSRQTLRLHLVRNAAQHAGVQRHRGDDRGLSARRRHSHDPPAGRAGMAHPARYRHRRAGRHCSHRGRCGPGARGRQVVALSTSGAAQFGQGQARTIWGINGINYRQDDQRQHAGGGDDRNAHRRGQRLRHRFGPGHRRGDHRQQRPERLLRISRRTTTGIRRW